MKYLVHCGCGNTGEFAKDAFKMLFPDKELPKTIDSRIQLKLMSNKFPEYEDEIRALYNSEEAYAYYIDTETKEMWDLLKGARVQ